MQRPVLWLSLVATLLVPMLVSAVTDADFEAKTTSDTMVVFENPAHDFPQRIIYRRRGTDSLLARIEGTVNGQTRAIDFPSARTRCP